MSLQETLRTVLRAHQADWDDSMGFICTCLTKAEGLGPDGAGLGDWIADHQAKEVLYELGLSEEFGVQYERDADPTMDNPSGIVTNTMTVRNENYLRQVMDSPAPLSARNKRAVRRIVGPWREEKAWT